MAIDTSRIARRTRLYRSLHRWLALPLMAFLLLAGLSGLLLGWKKPAGLLPPTQTGANTDSRTWVSLDSLRDIAQTYARTTLRQPDEIDRMDIRPAKGTAKIVFARHFTELQLDCRTGRILSVDTRRSDIIEKMHDGSILDYLLGTGGETVKMFYTTGLSLGLVGLSVSGFWLWYNPIRIRRGKQE